MRVSVCSKSDPNLAHFGRATENQAARTAVMTRAFARHSARFVLRVPVLPQFPMAVWINPPSPESSSTVLQPQEVLQ